MSAPPIMFRWNGEAMEPTTPFMARQCDGVFTIGEAYTLVEHHDRSAKGHAHYFARLNELWQTLPESLAAEYPTVEHLRKKALIRAGFADERSVVCSSAAEAQRIAAFIRPVDDYAIVVAQRNVVAVFTAKSQSMKAMGRDVFQRSKDAVLQFAERLTQRDAA